MKPFFSSRHGRLASAVVAVLVALLLAPAARAQGIPFPFLPHVETARFAPVQPQDDASTLLILESTLPFRCGGVTSAQVLDSAHVAITLRAQSSCPDSASYRYWQQILDLGVLHRGMHAVGVSARFEWPDGSVTTESGTVPFEVVHVEPPPPIDSTGTTMFLRAWIEPERPEVGQAVTLSIEGRFPYTCGEFAEAFVDAEHQVHLRVRRLPSCPDTSKHFVRCFAMGVLPKGQNLVWVRAAIEDLPGRTGDSLAIVIPVIDPNDPPPTPIDSTGIQFATVPAAPTDRDPVTVIARGRFAYDCGQVADVRVDDATHLAMTLRSGPACGDTARTWEQHFDIGVLPAGTHSIQLVVTIEGDGDTRVQRAWFAVEVTTPVDSLPAVLGVSSPNPFRGESRFSVTLDQATTADVSVYDVNGRRVATVFRGQLAAGSSMLRWNGRRGDGSWAPSGVYFYRLTLPNRVMSRRVVLLATP